ncbi:ABC transporter permease, partial [Escherichia coli]|nr:ABC transporter permease [Escherichia coli]
IVGERQNGNFANLLETKNLIPYLSESKDKFSKFNKNYKQSIIKVVKLNDNLIELERKNYIETPTSIGITLLVSLTFI